MWLTYAKMTGCFGVTRSPKDIAPLASHLAQALTRFGPVRVQRMRLARLWLVSELYDEESHINQTLSPIPQ